MTSDRELIGAARRWASHDPDEDTRAEVEALLRRVRSSDVDARQQLAMRFSARLSFGTAGLRAELGAGPARMNRVVVSQTTAGLARFLRGRAVVGTPHVVIGYDARTNSQRFAEDCAEVAAGSGLRVTLLPRQLPTPVLAFAVRHLGADAGIMITASHNPPRDNGYKVYLGGPGGEGSQIIPPDDRKVAEHIDDVARIGAHDLPRSRDYSVAPESVIDAYVARAAAVRQVSPSTADVKTVYTAMHGVGWETFRRAAGQAGFPVPIPVAKQVQPDPAFPTVAFPNPEESGALDLAIQTARATGADLILANDPDADRLAVAAADPTTATGFRQLTGNEIGILLGWRAAEAVGRAGRAGSLARSLVSSPALDAIARHYCLPCYQTGTGFKWISRAPGLAFGYEEAIGYLVDPDSVRDKDGISAAIAVMDLASQLAAQGTTLLDRLHQFAGTFGAFDSVQVAHRVSDPRLSAQVITVLQNALPAAIGSLPVIQAAVVGGGSILQVDLEHARLMIRASGTEPKIKFYLDTWSMDGSPAERIRAARNRLTDLRHGVAVLTRDHLQLD